MKGVVSYMFHILIGFLFSALIFFFYLYINPKPSFSKTQIFCFFALHTYGTYSLLEKDQWGLWLAFLLFSYLCLEDFHRASITVFIPIWLSLCFYFFKENPYPVFWSVAFFLVFLALDWVWERFIPDSWDLLFLFPLSYLFLFPQSQWVAFSIFGAMVLLSRFSKDKIVGEGDAYVILPILYVLPVDDYISFFMISLFLALPFAYYQLRFTTKTDFPFVPYIVTSFLLLYNGHSTIIGLLIIISLVSFVILFILYLILLYKQKRKQ